MDKNNAEVVKPKFFSKSFRKTPVVILVLILAAFTVMGYLYSVEKLASYAEREVQVVNIVVVKK
jgi:hypothetical protein